MLNGINHLTISVKNVEESFDFYTNILGFKPMAKWDEGAYLLLGELWFCLNFDKVHSSKDCSHIAFDISIEDFDFFTNKLIKNGVIKYKENTTEGPSLYFLDPNGHKLELHAGSLKSRLASLKKRDFMNLEIF